VADGTIAIAQLKGKPHSEAARGGVGRAGGQGPRIHPTSDQAIGGTSWVHDTVKWAEQHDWIPQGLSCSSPPCCAANLTPEEWTPVDWMKACKHGTAIRNRIPRKPAVEVAVAMLQAVETRGLAAVDE